MSATVPEHEPAEVTAGDTWKWSKSLDDYPADQGWSLTYYLTPTTGSVITIAAAADGADFLVTVVAATTAGYSAATYLLTGFVSKGAERYQIYSDDLIVNANPTTAYEWRSYARRMLALIEATIAGAVTRRDISYSINGRSFTAKTDEDLIKARNYFKSELRAEDAGGRNRKILARFTVPA